MFWDNDLKLEIELSADTIKKYHPCLQKNEWSQHDLRIVFKTCDTNDRILEEAGGKPGFFLFGFTLSLLQTPPSFLPDPFGDGCDSWPHGVENGPEKRSWMFFGVSWMRECLKIRRRILSDHRPDPGFFLRPGGGDRP